MAVQPITSKDQFDTLIASGKVVFIDFYADWCGPCRQISPVFDDLAVENTSRESVEFYKINIDHVQDLAEALGIRSIPTFHAYKNGQRLDQIVGASRATLQTFVQKSSVA